MKKDKAKVHEYRSMKEYEKRYYPESFKKQSIEITDPDTLGIILAKESLNKFKHLIQKQKVSIWGKKIRIFINPPFVIIQ